MKNALDRINRRVYATRGALKQYGGAEGWIDAGERRAVSLLRRYAEGGRVLDLGIGGGRTVALLRELGTGYVGIDYTPSLIATARRRYPDADLRDMDARRLDFPDSSFRAAFFSYNGIDSVDPNGRAEILREVMRVLEPGGVFVFSSLNRDGTVYGESPWATRPHGRRAVDLLRYLKRTAFGALHTARNRKLFRDDKEIAVATISVHDFGMVTVFVSPPAQVQALERAGFEIEGVIDDRDARDVRDQLGRTRAPWLYYIARKPLRGSVVPRTSRTSVAASAG